jgi:WD40 repeat protein
MHAFGDPVAPSTASVVGLPSQSNILQASVQKLQLETTGLPEPVLLVSSADKRLSFFSIASDASPAGVSPTLVRSRHDLQDSPILSFAVLASRYLAFTTISGSIAIYDACRDVIVAIRRDHAKYAVQVVSVPVRGSQHLLATASWDGKLMLYHVDLAEGDTIELGPPCASVTLASLPESILFVRDPVEDALYLLCARRDSTLLHYYRVGDDHDTVDVDQLPLAGKQNIAPFSNSWVSFSPSSMSLCPTDGSLIAVATSSMPNMKALIVRLLFPRQLQQLARSQPNRSFGVAAAGPAYSNPIEDLEASAVQIHTNTLVSQSQYSTPVVTWRPDGSGLWCNSEDGVIRGIESSTGKITEKLKGHEPNVKIRCLWAGYVSADEGPRVEWLVSGGFDQKLIIWTAKSEEK